MSTPHRFLALLLLQALFACGADVEDVQPEASETQGTERTAFLEHDLSGVEPNVRAAVEARRAQVFRSPDDWEAWRALGLVCEANGLMEWAMRSYQATIDLRPRRIKAWYRLGLAAADVGDFERAVAAFRHVVDGKKEYAPARLRLALSLLELGRVDEALEVARRAKLKAPAGEVDAHLVYGRALLQADRAADAVEALEAIAGELEESPNRGYGLLLLGTALRGAGELARADELLASLDGTKPRWLDPWAGEVLEHRVGSSVAHRYSVDFEGATGEERALDVLEHGYRDDPTDPQILNALARAYVGRGADEDARRILSELIALEPTNRRAYHNLAAVLGRLGLYDEAVAAADKAIAVQPERAASHALRAELLRGQGKPAEALAGFRRARELDGRADLWSAAIEELEAELAEAGR